MKGDPVHDYNQDSGDRLIALLDDVSFRDKLIKPARKAGEQLEFLKPMMLGASPRGIIGGPVAYVERGTILIVLANTSRVFTVHLRQPPPELRVSRLDVIGQMVDFATEAFAARSPEEMINLSIPCMKEVLQHHGGPPAKQGPEVKERITAQILGILMATLPPDRRLRMLDAVESCAAAGVCPALVGLIGPSTSGKRGLFCGVWPLTLAFAPYVEDALGDNDAPV